MNITEQEFNDLNNEPEYAHFNIVLFNKTPLQRAQSLYDYVKEHFTFPLPELYAPDYDEIVQRKFIRLACEYRMGKQLACLSEKQLSFVCSRIMIWAKEKKYKIGKKAFYGLFQ